MDFKALWCCPPLASDVLPQVPYATIARLASHVWARHQRALQSAYGQEAPLALVLLETARKYRATQAVGVSSAVGPAPAGAQHRRTSRLASVGRAQTPRHWSRKIARPAMS